MDNYHPGWHDDDCDDFSNNRFVKNEKLFSITIEEGEKSIIVLIDDMVTNTELYISEGMLRERGASAIADAAIALLDAVKPHYRQASLFGEKNKYFNK